MAPVITRQALFRRRSARSIAPLAGIPPLAARPLQKRPAGRPHGRGVGTAIVRALEQIAFEHQLAFLELDSTLTAEPFYRSLGYVSQGRITHWLDSGQPMASIRMRKELPQ
jgi:hypothetical protein